MLSESMVKTFAGQMAGRVCSPGEDEYDEARTIWNAMINKRPALIACCASTADVVAAVGFAGEHGLLVSVRGGGHNVAGNAVCDDGLMIDLSLMKRVDVDTDARTVRAQGGCTLYDLDSATAAHDLAVPAGIVSATGIGGLTLGGGVGWLVRKYGMTCDNLISAEVVTADGEVVIASSEENEDLFWGLRGGGGNFGVVTTFEYRAHPVGQVIGGMILHPRSAARDVMHYFREFTKAAPQELTLYCALLTTPDGTPVTALIGCYCGDTATGQKVLQPLREFGSPIADTLEPIPRLQMQTLLDGAFPDGNQNYWKSAFLNDLTDAAIDTLIEHGERMSSPLSALICEYYYGGPSSLIGETETAFAHRGAQYDLGIIGQWTDSGEDAIHKQWARDTYDAMQPYANGRIYANLMGGDQITDAEQLRAVFGVNYERLVALKRKYDPTNFFRLNQNIDPG